MTERTKFTTIGLDFEYEIDGSVVRVYDANGALYASAEKDDAVEALYYDYHNEEEGKLEDFGGSTTNLYRRTFEEIAVWLANTHPEL